MFSSRTSAKAQKAVKGPLLPRDWRKELEPVVSVLNGPISPKTMRFWDGDEYRIRDNSVAQLELRRLVDQWHASGPNLVKLLKENEQLRSAVDSGRTFLMPTRTGRAFLSWEPAPRSKDRDLNMEFAVYHFVSLIVNPECDLLGLPCVRCGKYFVKKNRRQTKYCSKVCGSRMTGAESQRNKRRADRAERIQTAQTAIEQWKSSGSKREWKAFVSMKTKFTLHWLTRAARSGSLTAPPSTK